MSGLAAAGGRAARVAVVGAGVAGLACARALVESGFGVRVFEREAVPGGRVATRRVASLTFDHGVQYFTAQDPRFEPVLRRWQAGGVVACWDARTRVLTAAGPGESIESGPRFVGVPNMEAVAVYLARGLDLSLSVEVRALERHGGRWMLRAPDGSSLDETGFDRVVLAIPSAIAARLLGEHPDLAQRAASVAWDSCWTVMLGLARPSTIEFDAAFVGEDPILGWIARESSKPRRAPLRGAAESWILQAHPGWSRSYVQLEHAAASRWIQRAFAARVGRPLMQVAGAAHLWRLALPVNPLPEPFLYDPLAGIGLAGDWCGGPRVEGAYLSGTALAQAIAS